MQTSARAARLVAIGVLLAGAGVAGAAGVRGAPAAAPAAAPAPPLAHPASAAPAAPAAPAADYAVRLARPVAAGERRLAVGFLESDDHLAGTKAGVPSDQRQTATVRYVVATEILEVSPKGNALRATLTVRRLTKESGGVTLELAKPGAVVTARLVGRKGVFELAGARLAPDLQTALAAALPLRADDEPTDDDLFGTAQRRRVGESWPANAELFARLGAASVTFDPQDVAGTVTLAAVKPIHGEPCLEVRWKLEARHGAFNAGALPLGFSGVASSLSVNGSALLPVAPALPPASRETAITAVADIGGASDGGGAVKLHHELRQIVRVELSKIP